MEVQLPRTVVTDIMFHEKGYILNEFILDDKMPLIVAVVSANNAVIEELISAGADINAVDKSGKTALHWAVKFENALTDAVDILLKHGANFAARDNVGRTPLHYATRDDAATKLLDAGADANAQDKGTFTPLHLAVEAGTVAVVEALLRHSTTNVNARTVDGITVMMFAIDSKSSGRKIAMLIEAGADINLREHTGATALHIAAELNDVDAMQTLLRYGADREDQDGYGHTMLHNLICSGVNDAETFLDTLLGDGVTNLNTSAPDGTTLLMSAVQYTNSRIVEKLVIAGAAVDTADNYGNTALHWAVHDDEMDSLSVLLDHGANINAQNDRGQTPLFLAAQYGSFEICSLLLRKFAEIYIQDHVGRLPIDVANAAGYADIVFLLNRQPSVAG